MSHSSVPLPVDAFIERLDDLSMDYCPHYSPSFDSSPENFLKSLERYLYVNKVCTLILFCELSDVFHSGDGQVKSDGYDLCLSKILQWFNL